MRFDTWTHRHGFRESFKRTQKGLVRALMDGSSFIELSSWVFMNKREKKVSKEKNRPIN